MGLAPIPGAPGNTVDAMALAGVPAHQDRHHAAREDGLPLHGTPRAALGVAKASELLGVPDGDLDRPARPVGRKDPLTSAVICWLRCVQRTQAL